MSKTTVIEVLKTLHNIIGKYIDDEESSYTSSVNISGNDNKTNIMTGNCTAGFSQINN